MERSKAYSDWIPERALSCRCCSGWVHSGATNSPVRVHFDCYGAASQTLSIRHTHKTKLCLIERTSAQVCNHGPFCGLKKERTLPGSQSATFGICGKSVSSRTTSGYSRSGESRSTSSRKNFAAFIDSAEGGVSLHLVQTDAGQFIIISIVANDDSNKTEGKKAGQKIRTRSLRRAESWVASQASLASYIREK
eukprot:COSAG05_NODE_2143_length_3485_cov_1.647076_2_plen_193_part_00